MNDQIIIDSAREYVNHLGAAAKENHFEAAEGWNLRLVDGRARRKLERKYHLTITKGLLPESVRVFMTEVITVMTRAGSAFSRLGDLDLKTSETQFLVAYNSKRGKR